MLGSGGFPRPHVVKIRGNRPTTDCPFCHLFIASGPLRVTIKYVEERARTCIFQRGIRLSVRDRYGGQKKIAIDLRTKDPAKVARLVGQLNAQLEAEWDALERDPMRSPRVVSLPDSRPKLDPAAALLDRWGLRPLAPGENSGVHAGKLPHDPMALELLHDHFDRKREAFAAGDEHAYREAHPTDYLDAVELAAWQRLYVPPVDTVRDVLRVYLDTDQKQGPKAAKFRRDATASFNDLIAVIGDKAATDVVRADAHAFVRARLAAGDATATIRRKLNTFVAAWTRYRREQAPDLPNPFEGLKIPNEGADKKKRVPFTAAELAALYAACRAADDDLRWLFALMIDTGARLAEVAGLGLDDLVLDGAVVPHMVIRDRPWRRLKTANSARSVPLVGASLWAAGRIAERAQAMAGTDAAVYCFPRYTDGETCKATNASNALAKWVKKVAGRGGNHELRHSIIDRLRAVQCPRDISHSITGHTSQDVGDSYGVGYSLEVKREWLLKVALSAP